MTTNGTTRIFAGGGNWVSGSGARYAGGLFRRSAGGGEWQSLTTGLPDKVEARAFAVHPREQGKGIGSALLDFAERRARTKGLLRIGLYTHERMARNLLIYARRGYQHDRKPPGEDSPRVYLSKEV